MNEAMLEEVQERIWSAIGHQVIANGVTGKNKSGSCLVGYMWGFVDGYLEEIDQYSEEASESSMNTLTFRYFAEVDIANVDPEKLINQEAQFNEEFSFAYQIGLSDAKAYALNNSAKLKGLSSINPQQLEDKFVQENSLAFDAGALISDAFQKAKDSEFLNTIQASFSSTRLEENQLYEAAFIEFEKGEIDKGIWARSLADADGDQDVAKARYLKLRVQKIRDEAKIVQKEQKAIQSRRLKAVKKIKEQEQLKRNSDLEKARKREVEEKKERARLEFESKPEGSAFFVNLAFIFVLVMFIVVIAGAMLGWDLSRLSNRFS